MPSLKFAIDFSWPRLCGNCLVVSLWLIVIIALFTIYYNRKIMKVKSGD